MKYKSNKNEIKSQQERDAFKKFVLELKISIDKNTIRSGAEDGDPDIICNYCTGEIAHFELMSASTQSFVAHGALLKKTGISKTIIGEEKEFESALRRKFTKNYKSTNGVSLLIYFNGTSFFVDEQIIESIFRSMSDAEEIIFKDIYYHGERIILKISQTKRSAITDD